MLMPFLAGYRITQEFGKRPEYYKQFGFAGHEGLDLVPVDSDFDIYAVEDGEVLRDVDPGEKVDAYGYLTAVWNPQSKRCWWYAHNAFNLVEPGQLIKRGEKIAKMGSSGNVDGAHLHLGLTLSDENKVRLNTANGYKGFINPLPVLIELNKGGVMPVGNTVVANDVYSKLVGNSDKWDKTVKYVELPSDPSATAFEDVQRVIGGLKSRATDLQNQLNASAAELKNRVEQVSRQEDQLTNEAKLRQDLTIKLNQSVKIDGDSRALLEGQISTLQAQVDSIAKEKGGLNTDLVAAQQKASEWEKKYTDLLANHAASNVSVFDAVIILVRAFLGLTKTVQLKKVEGIDFSKLLQQ